jgi:hypothetical protein
MNSTRLWQNNSVGIFGQTNNPASVAGYFQGDVVVDGNFTVIGFPGQHTKSVTVPFPDGTQRLMYCMESPELWFEDFGTAKLKNGRAVIKLDRDFAKVIKRGDYKVFPAPEGDCRGLYVRRKRAASFEVREVMGAGRAFRSPIASSRGAKISSVTAASPLSASACGRHPWRHRRRANGRLCRDHRRCARSSPAWRKRCVRREWTAEDHARFPSSLRPRSTCGPRGGEKPASAADRRTHTFYEHAYRTFSAVN